MDPFPTTATSSAPAQPAAHAVGPEAHVAEAYAAHRDELYSYLMSTTRDAHVAEDVVQEAFVRLTREVGAGRAPRNQRAWLYQVGRNLAISRGRRQQVAQRWLTERAQLGVGASAEEHFLLREARSELQNAMLELNTADRTALLMAAEGYSGAEIAARLGHSSAAVRTRLCRARSRLRGRLEGSREGRSMASAA